MTCLRRVLNTEKTSTNSIMSIPSYEEIQFKDIEYQLPEKQGPFYYAPMSYRGAPLLVTSPRLSSTCLGTEILGRKTPGLDAEIQGKDFLFYDFMLKMDDRNIKETCAQSQAWFQKSLPLDLIDDMYKRTNKPLKSQETPSFFLRLPVLKGEVQCKIFDQHKVVRALSEIHPGQEFSCVIHFKGLKFLKQHYYCDCYLSQIKIYLPEAQPYHILDTCVFSEEEEDLVDQEILDTIQRKDEEIHGQRKACEATLAQKEAERTQLTQEISDLQSHIEHLTQLTSGT